jgi:hypothetical protein
MQNTDDTNGTAGPHKEDCVTLILEPEIPFANMIRATRQAGIRGQRLEAAIEPRDIGISALFAEGPI